MSGTSMVDGHPSTEHDGGKFTDLSNVCDKFVYPERSDYKYTCPQKIVIDWISEHIHQSNNMKNIKSSYTLKNILEDDTGIYLTNDQFKDIMYMMGFKPLDMTDINWEFVVTLYEESNFNFYSWGCQYINLLKWENRDDAIFMSDFLYDMVDDSEFPKKKFQNEQEEFMVILAYLFYSTKALQEAIDGFLVLWKKYISSLDKYPSDAFEKIFLPIYKSVFENVL